MTRARNMSRPSGDVARLVEQFVRRAVVEVRVFGDDALQAVLPDERERVACHDIGVAFGVDRHIYIGIRCRDDRRL